MYLTGLVTEEQDFLTSGESPFLGDCYLSTKSSDVSSALQHRAPTSGVSFCWSVFQQSLCLESPTVLSGRSLRLEPKAAALLWNVICYSVLQKLTNLNLVKEHKLKPSEVVLEAEFATSGSITFSEHHCYNCALVSFPGSLVRCPERHLDSEEKPLIKIQSNSLIKG